MGIEIERKFLLADDGWRAAAHKVKQQRCVLILQMLLIRSRRHARPNLNHGTPSFASIWI